MAKLLSSIRNLESSAKAAQRAQITGTPGNPKAPVTNEIIEAVLGNGKYQVKSTAVPATGHQVLVVGQRVSVAWKNGKPFVILAHSAQRAQFLPLPSKKVGGIVEELFIAPDPDQDGQVDVWFRNYSAATPVALKISPLGGQDPVAVRWGINRDRFVVMTGDTPETTEFFIFKVLLSKVPETFRESDKIFEDGQVPDAVLETEVDPKASMTALTTMGAFGTTQHTTYRTIVMRAETTSTIANTGLINPDCTPVTTLALSIEEFVDADYIRTAALGAGSVLRVQNLFGVAGDVGWGAFVEVADFGLDKDGHLLVSLKVSVSFFSTVSPSWTGTLAKAVVTHDGCIDPGDPHGRIEIQTPSAASEFAGGVAYLESASEAHLFIADLTANVILLTTVKETHSLHRTTHSSVGIRTFPGEPATPGLHGLLHHAVATNNSAHLFTGDPPVDTGPICSGGDGDCTTAYLTGSEYGGVPLMVHDEDPAVLACDVTGLNPVSVNAYGKLGENGEEESLTSLWDAAGFPYIVTEGSLQHSASLAPGDSEQACASAVFVGAGPDGKYGAWTFQFHVDQWTETTDLYTYSVVDAQLLQNTRGIPGSLKIFLVINRSKLGSDQTAVFIIQENKTLFATLRPWGDEGLATIELLARNNHRLLWSQRENDTGLTRVYMTDLDGIVTNVQVGSKVSDFNELVLTNPDFLYDAREDDRLFVDGWDPITKHITLDAAAEGFPPEDSSLIEVKALFDMITAGDPPTTVEPADADFQTINDPALLDVIGRLIEGE